MILYYVIPVIFNYLSLTSLFNLSLDFSQDTHYLGEDTHYCFEDFSRVLKKEFYSHSSYPPLTV